MELGYTPNTIRNMLKDIGHLGRWMESELLEDWQLTEGAVAAFIRECRIEGRRRVPSVRCLTPLLEYLRSEGVLLPEIPPSTPVDQLMTHYRRWLIVDRGLAAATVLRYETLARRFLHEREAIDGAAFVEDLKGPDVVGFLVRECTRVTVGAAKGRVAELRSLLRFLYLKGLTPLALATAIPPVAGWHDTRVPRGIGTADVQRLLAGCDRSSAVGIRDFAILMLVARLGLRSIEVARLELSDIDWRAGEIGVRGKARRRDLLPLPTDVGEALSCYLREARRATTIRQVFVAHKAPIRAIRPDLVSDVTRRACERVGIPRVGAHRLRHALAAELLRRGATLVEVSQVLRHRDLATTAVYAKVDLSSLRNVAQPWPGSSPVSALRQAAEDYLALRRSLGHDLAEAHRLLPRFVAYLEAIGAQTVTIEAALAWSQVPEVDPSTSVWPRRMTIARGFARHMAGIDPSTQVPPPGLIPSRQRWRPPFIYSPADVAALMAEARAMRWRLPAATHESVIGLLSATGMRVGEAVRLDRGDIDWIYGVLMIRESKFGKSRQVPVLPSTLEALARYAEVRDELCQHPTSASFFVSVRDTRVSYPVIQQVFRRLCSAAGVGAESDIRPRIHDFRHSFAVRTLLNWYRSGEDVEARLPWLSTYLGHRDPRSTYWYLSAAPELLALAAGRLELSRGVISR